MIILGIETSCDETSVATLSIRKGKRSAKLLSQMIASQNEIHAPYGGIVPELASRRHIEILSPMTEETLKKAGLTLAQIEGIAVTSTPGLVGSLLVGLSFAKSLALGLKIPFLGVNHLEGHLNAPFLEHPSIPYPHIGLIVSGGHTALYEVKKFGEYLFLGGTRDDAAGEAFDKTAKLLGLGYPGGPIIDRLAHQGNPTAIKFPVPNLKGYDFSFSGLKTAVRKTLLEAGGEGRAPATRAVLSLSKDEHGSGRNPSQDPLLTENICASFQETVVDHLIDKSLAAAKNRRCKAILLTGGVACNSRLKEKLAAVCEEKGLRLFYPSPVYCTDNAAMIAYTGGRHLLRGLASPLNLNAIANLDLKSPLTPLCS